MLEPGLACRLAHQLESFRTFTRDADPADLSWTPPSGKWSALANLAHVGRHHEVMQERLDRVLQEDAPVFARYREDEDPGWATWSSLPAAQVWAQLTERRSALCAWTVALTPEQVRRIGVHAKFGPLDVAGWLEFFLVHEGHHLYVALQRLAEARAGRA